MRTGGVGFGRRPFYTIQPNSRAFTLAALRYGRDKRRLLTRERTRWTTLFIEPPVASVAAASAKATPSATMRRKEELCESTWAIVQDRHPFRDLTNESDLKHQLRRKLFILAENSYLEDLDGLQRSVLEAFARGVDY